MDSRENGLNRLQYLIRDSNKSLKEISEDLDIGYSTLASYAQGIRFPKKSMLHAMADYFNVSVSFLLGADEITRDLNTKEIIALLKANTSSYVMKSGSIMPGVGANDEEIYVAILIANSLRIMDLLSNRPDKNKLFDQLNTLLVRLGDAVANLSENRSNFINMTLDMKAYEEVIKEHVEPTELETDKENLTNLYMQVEDIKQKSEQTKNSEFGKITREVIELLDNTFKY